MNTNRFVCFFRLLALLVGACCLTGLQTARAQLNFTLQNPNPTVAPGSTFAFFATLTNTDPNNSISLTGASFSYTDPNAASNFSDNFLNTPPSLNPAGMSGSSWTGDLFDVTVPANYVPGTVYTGTYEIDFIDGSISGSVTQNFSVTVGGHATTPELGSVWGLLLLVGLGMLWRLGVRRGAGSLSRISVALLCGVLLYGSGIGRAQAQGIEPVVLVHNFNGPNDGANPEAGVIQGKDGALYGTTHIGGANNDGVVFKVNPDGSNYQVLHTFSALPYPSTNSDGAHPLAGVTQGSDGVLYGTATYGGAYGWGVVFKVNPDGSNFQVIHAFTRGNDGGYPYAGVIQGSDRALYGTTYFGGAFGYGVVYKVNTDGSNFQVLHHFNSFNGQDGAFPYACVIEGKDGALYGTTYGGGTMAHGVVYKINRDGSNYQVLHNFTGGNSDGDYPYFAGVIQGSDGALYGTTAGGGAHGEGIVFRLDTDGSNFQVIHSFSAPYDMNGDNSDGSHPRAGVIQGSDGALYGTTEFGGANNDGVVFKLNTDGSNFQMLHSFKYGYYEGAFPHGGVIQGKDGNLYGTNLGVIFRIGPQALFLNPNNAPAGSNNLTLTLLGNGFAQNDTLLWNGTISLTPTSVSSDGTQIQATIPANLLINPGSATLQVQDPNIHNTTSPLVLLIGAVQIRLQISSIARDSNNNVVVTLTITNTGGALATNLAVTLATLTDSTKQKFNTSSSLPLSLGTLSAGGSVSATLVFPSTAASGSGLLQVRGSYGGGSFSGNFRVTVP